MLQDKKETIYCCSAEALTSQDHLTVCVFVDILNKPVAAVESTPDAVHQVLNWNNPSLCVYVFHFTIDIFEYGTNHTHHRNQERTKQNGAQVVSD